MEIKRRNTLQRQIILNVVNDSFDHPTAETIYTRVKTVDPKISFATVYRNLNLLTEEGKIAKLHIPNEPDHFDFNTSMHYHFYCVNCKEVTDIPVDNLPLKQLENVKIDGYKILKHELNFIGICKKCNYNEEEG